MSAEVELRACPFCGGAPELSGAYYTEDCHAWSVSCGCGLFLTPNTISPPDQEAAITAWNTRDPALLDRLERAEEGRVPREPTEAAEVAGSVCLYVQFSDDGMHIRDWSHNPFDGAIEIKIEIPPATLCNAATKALTGDR